MFDTDSEDSLEDNIEILLQNDLDSNESSIEVPQADWSSLILAEEQENVKRRLNRQGLYDPGRAELCEVYVRCSNSSVFRHVYYNYPPLLDPGIKAALLEPQGIITYGADGQELYLALCKEAQTHPIRCFHTSLMDDKIDLKYYGIFAKAFRPIALALSRNTNVKFLDLTGNWISLDGCYHLGEMLRTNVTITEMNLSGCKIGSRGAKRLFACLRFNRSLTKLNLSGNELQDTGIMVLTRAIIKGTNVVNWDLSKNKLTSKAVLDLADAFQERNKFTHLNLSYNNIYSPRALLLLCTFLSDNEDFQELDLSWNALQGPRVGQAIRMLLLNRKIRSVNLSNNKLNGAAITEIASNLSKARKLETLNLSYNPLTALDAMKLIRHLKLRAVKLKKLLLDNIIVNSDFIEAREKILSLSFRKKAIITHGYVSDRFIPKKLDVRELLLKRAGAIGRSAKKKKNRIDVGLLLLELYKINPEPVLAKDFVQIMIRRGVHIDEDFASEMAEAFPGPTKGKIDLAAVEEYMKRLWPDKELPPTPPPEPEPEPEPLPKPKKDKKRKK